MGLYGGAAFSPLSLIALGSGAWFGIIAVAWVLIIAALLAWWNRISEIREREEAHALARHLDVAVPVWSRTPLYDWHTDETPTTGVYGSPRRRSGDE